MGHEAIIYGRILGARGPVGGRGRSQADSYRALQARNRAIINRLPREDDRWPWLVRGMFALPAGWPQGTYRQQVIHFGASFKDDPSNRASIEGWLAKFEGLLRQLYWLSAVVHLETDFEPPRSFEWLPTPAALQRLYADPPMPITEWTRGVLVKGMLP